MIKFKLYRKLHVFFGARSFVKKYPDGNAYVLVKGNNTSEAANQFQAMGFEEEWPLTGSMW